MKTKILLLITMVVGIAQSIYYYFHLPEKIASHFGPSGIPDSWMTKNAYLALEIGMVLFITLLMLSIPFFLKITPIFLINFPKKDYWLAPERKQHSLKIICPWFYIFGAGMNIFFIFIFYLAYRANLSEPIILNDKLVWWGTSCFLVFLIVWIIGLYSCFNKN